jgi:3-isopropylmalate/(R)-2-methylmalate dehydratase small subunit
MSIIDRYVAQVEGTVVPVPGDDIDTDRIIPARFMKGITFDGLGEYAFFDERFDDQGKLKVHPFNDKRFYGARVMLVGRNFGCGSSREHAPQALMRYGIRALIGFSFADIFAGNCTQLGIPAVRITQDIHEKLSEIINRDPQTKCTVDLDKRCIMVNDERFSFAIEDSSRHALVAGMWDTTSLLLENRDLIDKKAKELPYVHL